MLLGTDTIHDTLYDVNFALFGILQDVIDLCCLRYLTQLCENLGVSYPEAKLTYRRKMQESLKVSVKLHCLATFQLSHGGEYSLWMPGQGIDR
jgi:hypothetical protein